MCVWQVAFSAEVVIGPGIIGIVQIGERTLRTQLVKSSFLIISPGPEEFKDSAFIEKWVVSKFKFKECIHAGMFPHSHINYV